MKILEPLSERQNKPVRSSVELDRVISSPSVLEKLLGNYSVFIQDRNGNGFRVAYDNNKYVSYYDYKTSFDTIEELEEHLNSLPAELPIAF